MRSKSLLCVAIMMFRVSDVSQLGQQHRRRDMFKLRLFKICNRNPHDIEIPIHPITEAVLAMNKVTDLTYIATEFGRPFFIKSLGNRISDWFCRAGLGHLTAHSVRKGLAADVAHNRQHARGDVRLARWKDLKIYTKNADHARLAGRRSHESTGTASARNCWR